MPTTYTLAGADVKDLLARLIARRFPRLAGADRARAEGERGAP